MTFNDIVDNWLIWQPSNDRAYPAMPPSILMRLVKSSGVYESEPHRPVCNVRLAELTDAAILNMPEDIRAAFLGRHAHSVVWRKKMAALGDSSIQYATARVIIMSAVSQRAGHVA